MMMMMMLIIIIIIITINIIALRSTLKTAVSCSLLYCARTWLKEEESNEFPNTDSNTFGHNMNP